MHVIAQQLNKTLHGTIVDALLSASGRQIFFPKGIIAQAAEAKQTGVRYNATQGIMTSAGRPCALSGVTAHYNQLAPEQIVGYAPAGGVTSLRERWRQELRSKNSALSENLSLPIVTAGITNAISIVGELCIDPNDVIVVSAPYWGNYRLIFGERRRGRIISYPLFAPDGGYHIDMLDDALKQAVAACRGGTNDPAKVLCIFNFPNNPTGYTATTGEMEQIVQTLTTYAKRGVRLAVLCDDAYFGLEYEPGLMQQSLFAHLANRDENILAIKLDGATKEEYAWGFRVGFITFAAKGLTAEHYRALEQKVLGIIRSTTSSGNTAAQHILQAALESPTHEKEKRELHDNMAARYREVKRVLDSYKAHPRLRALPFNSGYFVALCCHGIDSEQLRVALLQHDIGIVAIDDRHIRVAYSTLDLEQIAPVFEVIFNIAANMA